MSLNKKILDELIMEVMQEKIYGDSWDDVFKIATIPATGTELETDASARTSFKDLADLQPKAGELDDKDLDYLLKNLNLVSTDIQKALYAIKYGAKDKALRDKADAVIKAYNKAVDAKALEPQTFSEPKITTTRAAITQTAKQGSFPSEIDNILDRVFKNEKTLSTRIRKLSDISKRFYLASGAIAAVSAEKEKEAGLQRGKTGDKTKKFNRAQSTALKQLQDLDLREFINQVMLMEYFVEISKSFDAGSGGYVFEWFLALLAGGYVAGKETGPGGGMGAVDFRYRTKGGIGKAGSAKYYAKKSDIKQSVEGFNFNEEVGYVIALKKQGMEQLSIVGRGTSDPTKIVAAEIYAPTVIRRKNTGANSVFEIDGTTVYAGLGKGAKIKLDGHLGKLQGILFIADVPTESFRDMMYRAVSDNINKTKSDLLAIFEKFFSTLTQTDSQARKYTSTGDINHGDAVINLLNQADDEFDELMSKFGQKATVDTIGKVRESLQNKKNEINSLKRLDKLIERVILYKNTEEK